MRFQFLLVFCVLTAYYYVYFMHDQVLVIASHETSFIQQGCVHTNQQKKPIVQQGNVVNMTGLLLFMLY